MNNGPLLFLGILLTAASSFCALLFAPQLQSGSQQVRFLEDTGEFYPSARTGRAEKGADVYRSLGCVECHSQQVRQTGVHFDVWVTELTTNNSAAAIGTSKVLPTIKEVDALKLFLQLPARLMTGVAPLDGPDIVQALGKVGVKAQAVVVNEGVDIERKWGRRMSVALDYLRDYPIQLGQNRLGPDLADFGGRETNVTKVLKHLYQPGVEMPGSIMPAYAFLFQHRTYKSGDTVPSDAVVLKAATATEAGELAIPNDDVLALATYLISLKAEASLFEAPIGTPPSAQAPAAAPAATKP